MAGNTIIVMAIVYVVTIAYSIYIAILNRKQAKIYGLMEENNRLLTDIRYELSELNKVKRLKR
jgi:mevalonate kinase